MRCRRHRGTVATRRTLLVTTYRGYRGRTLYTTCSQIRAWHPDDACHSATLVFRLGDLVKTPIQNGIRFCETWPLYGPLAVTGLGVARSLDHCLRSRSTFDRPASVHLFLHPSIKMATSSQISKKRKFIADGVFQAELGEFL